MNKGTFFVVSLVILGVLLWWFGESDSSRPTHVEVPKADPMQSRSPEPATTPASIPNIEERRKAVAEEVQRILATPVTFYGKVVDQNGEPVPDATVNYNALDKFNAPGSQYQGKSDANGDFVITGIVGAVLNVGVQKEGYYMIDGKSAAAFAYGIGPDSTRREPSTRDCPAVFILHKMGIAEPLIHVSRTYRLPRNGTPVEVDLKTGRVSAQGHLRVEAWTDDQVRDTRGRYTWRCRISVPNGGLIERQGQFDFHAPANGYRPSIEIVMLRTAEKWQPQAKRDYFIQLAGGNYARLIFYMIAQGDHFFEIQSYLNPLRDSRYLEFDPKKTVKSP